MQINHKEFKVINWEYDKFVFNPNRDPETEYFELKPKEYINYQETVFTPKNKKLLYAYFTIMWNYVIENEEQTKEILNYAVEDVYTTNIENFDNAEEELNKKIKESYKIFENSFDQLKPALGIRQPLPALEQSVIDYLFQAILLKLKPATS